MKTMKRILTACVLSVLASCSNPKSDIERIDEFYQVLLSQDGMTDGFLRQNLSQGVLDRIWEADFPSSYSYWALRTGYQDGPSKDSSVEEIKPLGNGWYEVTYTDLGFRGITDVKMEGGKIADFRPFNIPFKAARGYFRRSDTREDRLPVAIRTEEELLHYFGMAAVMGKDGEPTAVDFDKSFVIPVAFPETDRETDIVVDSFQRTGSRQLTLTVSTRRGEPQSYTVLPLEILVVDGFYRDFEIVIVADGKPYSG